MENQNTPEYLTKCLERLVENLRHVQHAPGIQMTALEGSAISADATAAAAEEAEDPDVRDGEAAADARVVKDNEVDDEGDTSGGHRDNQTFNSNDPEGPAAAAAEPAAGSMDVEGSADKGGAAEAEAPNGGAGESEAAGMEEDAAAPAETASADAPDAAPEAAAPSGDADGAAPAPMET